MNYAKSSGLTGAHLKWIAIITMLIDHIGAVILESGLLPKIANAVLAGNSYKYLVADYHFWFGFNEVLRMIGRLAFPLFCFLLVEGFLHTANIKKYAFRLGLFAFLSEIPFNLAVYSSFFYLQNQNVFFTLLIGLLALCGLRYFEDSLPKKYSWMRYIVVLTSALIAVFLRTDYDLFGIILIVLLYEFRNNRLWQCLGGSIIMLFNSITGCLAFIPVWFYNGKRGKQWPKYIFYSFYPVHLLLLFFLRMFIL